MSAEPKIVIDVTGKTLNEVLEIAPRTADGKVKYPLPCNCAGPKYINKCNFHQVEQIDSDARRAGVVDLVFNHREFLDLPSLVKTLQAIKLKLISNPKKSCVIKIIPETQDEADARRRD